MDRFDKTLRNRTQLHFTVDAAVREIIDCSAERRNIRPFGRIHIDGQQVVFSIAVAYILRDVNRKRGIAPLMLSCGLSIDKDLCKAHHSLKIDKKAHSF